jgi:hypothetical protein
MSNGVIITLIICVTLVVITYISRGNDKEK